MDLQQAQSCGSKARNLQRNSTDNIDTKKLSKHDVSKTSSKTHHQNETFVYKLDQQVIATEQIDQASQVDWANKHTESREYLSGSTSHTSKIVTKEPKNSMSGLMTGGVFKTWQDVSKFNYLSENQSMLKENEPSNLFEFDGSQMFVGSQYNMMNQASQVDIMPELFPIHITTLQNEERLWGCYYIFPELYTDAYSPTVRIRKLEDIKEIVGGVLTRDMINVGLSYLKRIPLLQDYVYIKLDLSFKHLSNIEVLENYKYLVYLDLSSNCLAELSVLKYLLYLQFLSVDFNKLTNVLEYDTPQWFLTEVRYKYNQIKKIRDISDFWSITILDLSHNNIKSISGLENLRFLRHLDLSFNHIQRFENLNHLRLLWLDLSYNNISTFEFSQHSGLWTLYHLEFINLNENNLTSLKMFAGCTRLRELHIRNNRIGLLLELAVFMRQLLRLSVLDMRANPICSTPRYMDVVINTFPLLVNLDSIELDSVLQRLSKIEMLPDVRIVAARKLNLLLYIEQLSKARVSKFIPPADTTEVPLIVLVGVEGSGKGALVRRLATECEDHVQFGKCHTTEKHAHPDRYISVNRSKFDDMLLAGDFLTYTEMNGDSYGLSREQAYINPGKVTVVCLDLVSALMLNMRNRRPYLILCHCGDTIALARRQVERKEGRDNYASKRFSMEFPDLDRSVLNIVLSGRIIITGILNEILWNLPENKERSEFQLESQCSLLMESEARPKTPYQRGLKIMELLDTNSTLSIPNQQQTSQMETSLYSLYKDSQGTEDGQPSDAINNSYDASNKRQSQFIPPRLQVSGDQHQKSVKSVRSSAGKAMVDGSKSSKSVTFNYPKSSKNLVSGMEDRRLTGLSIDPIINEPDVKSKQKLNSISTKIPAKVRHLTRSSQEDSDLWMGFLVETGLLQASSMITEQSMLYLSHFDDKIDDPSTILKSLDLYLKINMDNPETAFRKVKKLVKDIVNSQSNQQPMFDIDFANLDHYPNVQRKLADIKSQIAPHRLFF